MPLHDLLFFVTFYGFLPCKIYYYQTPSFIKFQVFHFVNSKHYYIYENKFKNLYMEQDFRTPY